MIFKEVKEEPNSPSQCVCKEKKNKKMLKYFFLAGSFQIFLLLQGVLEPNFCEKQGMTAYAY
jgi:hypothetical protein